MSKYTSRAVTINAPASAVVDKFGDMTVFKDRLDKIPADLRAKMGQVDFEPDAIVMTHPQLGQIRFSVVERTPSVVRMECTTPVRIELALNLEPSGADSTRATTDIDIDIPMMLKPFIAPHMQKVVDQFSDLLSKIAEV